MKTIELDKILRWRCPVCSTTYLYSLRTLFPDTAPDNIPQPQEGDRIEFPAGKNCACGSNYLQFSKIPE
jgi:hypothetical protein